MENLYKMAEKAVGSVQASFDPGRVEAPSNFVEAHLKEQFLAKEGSSFHGQIGKLNLIGTIEDLFAAGSFTVSHTLQWVCNKKLTLSDC